MKGIFLDVDGVLNNDKTEDRVFDEGNKYMGICPILLKRLHKIVNETGAKIILSSTWRKYPNFIGHLKNRMEELESGFSEFIIGKTPILVSSVYDIYGKRNEEIMDWISANEKLENFVVLDDVDLKLLDTFGEKFIQTNASLGLLDEHVDRAIQILNA